MSECRDCGKECGLNAEFCDGCSVDRIPDIYPCSRCNRQYSCSSKDFACKDCTTYEERQWLVDNWSRGASLRMYP
jgi:hypothetical protein